MCVLVRRLVVVGPVEVHWWSSIVVISALQLMSYWLNCGCCTPRSPSYFGKSLSTSYKSKYLKLFSNVDMASDVITDEWLLFIFVCQSCLPVQRREVWNICGVINSYCVKKCSSKVWMNKFAICFLLFWLIIVYVLILSVVFLCLFHVCFGMFSWSFWKAVSTPPSSPSVEVQ